MKERPILFSGEMVRAVLEGRKTQARRAISERLLEKYYDYDEWCNAVSPPDVACSREYEKEYFKRKCKYGYPGDQLWVREKWFEEYSSLTARPFDPPRAVYAATEDRHVIKFDDDGFTEFNKDGTEKSPWRPSIHMPRWASRITLEITNVRVERLNDISRGDAMEEGCPFPNMQDADPVGWYRDLWERINGAGSWDENPWVWVIEFEPMRKP